MAIYNQLSMEKGLLKKLGIDESDLLALVRSERQQ
jgi:hypothetical protein